MEIQQPQDIKLGKIAATKVVKKKKKAARVGFGRDDNEDDEAPEAATRRTSQAQVTSAAIAEITTTAVEVPDLHSNYVTEAQGPVMQYDETQEIQETLSEPPPLPSMPPPDFRPETPPVASVEEVQVEGSSVVADTSSSLFSGFNFVNNTQPEEEVVEENVTASGFSFVSTNPPTEVVEVQEPIPDTVREDIPEVISSEGDLTVPPQVLRALDLESAKLNDSIQGFVSLYNSAYSRFIELMDQAIASSRYCQDLTDKIEQLEERQNVLAEQEDFDQAAVISAEIEAIQSELHAKSGEKQRCLDMLKIVKAEYDQLRPSATDLFKSNVDTVLAFVDQAKTVEDAGRKRLEEFSVDEFDRLSVEEQRIQLEKSHCDREQATLQSESAVVEDAINSQVGDQLEKRKDLEVQSFAVQEEIRRLEELLAQKRIEEAEINKNLKQIDGKILEVRKKYERQLVRINERKEALNRAQSECAVEESIVAENRHRLESTISEAKESYRILKVQAETKTKEIDLAQLFMRDMQAALEAEEHSFSLDFVWYVTQSDEIYRFFAGEHLSSSSRELSDQVSRIEANIRAKSKAIEERRNDHEVSKARFKSILEIIERLEVEKRGHAANKRFKEAAATAKELKEAGEAKDKVDADITAHRASVDELEEAKNALVVQLEEARRQLREEQKVEKLVHYNIVRRRMQQVQRIQRRVLESLELFPSAFTSSLQDLYQREFDRLQSIRNVLVQECDIDESTLVEDVEEEETLPAPLADEISSASNVDAEVVTGGDDVPVSLIGASEEDLVAIVEAEPSEETVEADAVAIVEAPTPEIDREVE